MNIIHVYANPSLRNTYFIDLQVESARSRSFLVFKTSYSVNAYDKSKSLFGCFNSGAFSDRKSVV